MPADPANLAVTHRRAIRDHGPGPRQVNFVVHAGVWLAELNFQAAAHISAHGLPRGVIVLSDCRQQGARRLPRPSHTLPGLLQLTPKDPLQRTRGGGGGGAKAAGGITAMLAGLQQKKVPSTLLR